MARRFTGWHMLTIMLIFFGVVIGVNIVMARYAISTFGGTVVDNSYVASQRFNGWLAQARGQQKLGWKAELGVDPQRRVTFSVTGADGVPLGGLTLSAVAHHPLGREKEVPLTFIPTGAGAYRSLASLPTGRWIVRFEAHRGKDRLRLQETLG